MLSRFYRITRSLPVFAVMWLLLTAERCPAPRPVASFDGTHDYAEALNGLGRGLNNAYPDAKAAGFRATRVFLDWDKIQPVDGVLDQPTKDSLFTCRYTTNADYNGGGPNPPPWVPCDASAECHQPTACGLSADERVLQASGAFTAQDSFPVMITIFRTPSWAASSSWDSHCNGAGDHDINTRPMRSSAGSCPLPGLSTRACTDAWNDFVYAVADRYASAAFVFELWNEPDLCSAWSGSSDQYKTRVLPAAQRVKDTGAIPGLVAAPALANPSAAAMGAYLSYAYPIDYASIHTYGSPSSVSAQISDINNWCNGNMNCLGFYVTEASFGKNVASGCAVPDAVTNPGNKLVDVYQQCANPNSWCWGVFHYTLTDRTKNQTCDFGLLDTNGCRKGRLCTMATNYFGVTPPYACTGCGD